MSDATRKDFSTKAKETLTPEVMKSDAQKAKEAATDTTDRIAREAEPHSHKSHAQCAIDHTEQAKDNTKHGSTGATIGDKVKHALGIDKKEHHSTV